MIDASSTSLHPKQSNLIDKLVDQHIVDAFLSTHTSARSRDVETLNSSNSCRVRFDRSGARVTGLTGSDRWLHRRGESLLSPPREGPRWRWRA
jgi:hypothetical protein